MKLTAQRKAYIALLGVGLCALIVDRVCFAPSGAAAAQDDPPAPQPPTSQQHTDTADAVPAPASKTAPLSERLLQVAGDVRWDRPAGNAFVPPAAWITPKVAATPEPQSSESENFIQRHKISSVLSVGDAQTGVKTPVAVIIGGKSYRIGEDLDGCTLVSIDATGAEFKSRKGIIRVPLARPEERTPGPRHERPQNP